jgi:acetolactate synthase small subunit
MRVYANDEVFYGTPFEIIEQFREMLFEPNDVPNFEAYVKYARRTIAEYTEEKLIIPKGTDAEKADALLRQLDKIGLLEILDGDEDETEDDDLEDDYA